MRDALASTEFDLVIVGAGIHGAFAAWDAALRGHRVALIDRADFGGATSANSMKIAHGGLRYLQHADVARAWQSARERAFLFCLAPRLVQPLPCVLPTRGRGAHGRLALRAGLLLNDAITAAAAVAGCSVALPPNRILSREEYGELAGAFTVDGATGGALWHDGIITSTERFTIEIVRSAVGAGATATNHVEATDVLLSQGHVAGVRARSVEGHEFDIRARVVLNAAGPWAPDMMPGSRVRRPGFVRSCNMIVRRSPERVAAAVPAEPGRLLFTVPWARHTIIGTTQTAQGSATLSATDVEHDACALLARLNAALPRLQLDAGEITVLHAGVLPGPSVSGGRGAGIPADRPTLIDHATDGCRGLVTMMGVKWTTARRVAERAVDMCDAHLAKSRASPAILRMLRAASWTPSPIASDGVLPPITVARIQWLYGRYAADVLSIARADPALAKPLAPECATVGAEIAHAARHEMAHTLADAVLRRTELGSAGNPGRAALDAAASILSRELGWGADRAPREVLEVLAHYPRFGGESS